MNTSNKIVLIPLDSVVVDFGRNRQREAVEASYDDQQLRRQLEMSGQITPALVEKGTDPTTGKTIYFPLAGNRRSYNLKKLQAMGKVDPTTGKVFDSLKAKVYENLTERERLELTLDAGSIRGFNKVELFLATEWLFDAGYNEREAVVQLGNLIVQHYPPTKKFLPSDQDNGNSMFQYYRGTIQAMKRAWQGPVVLRDAYVGKLRRDQKWPTNKEIEELHKIFRDEIEAPENAIHMYSRINPGPKFMAEWNRRLGEWQEAAEMGNKPKSTSMMGRQAVEELIKQVNSKTLKVAFRAILKTINPDALIKLDKTLVNHEKAWEDVIVECAKSKYVEDVEPAAPTTVNRIQETEPVAAE